MNPPLPSEPVAHMSPPDASRVGRRQFIVGAGAAAGASAVAAAMPVGSAEAAVPAGASSFAPLPTAVRLADTRFPAKYTYSQLTPTRIRVKVAGLSGVPAEASAVVLTVTAVNFANPNFVTVFPTGIPIPTASNLNLIEANTVNANLVTVKVGSGGSVDVYSKDGAFLVVDVLGYYSPVAGAVRAGRFVGLSTAKRAIDTRNSGSGFAPEFLTVDVSKFVPAGASSVVLNLTATETTAGAYFTALPVTESTKPTTSSLNVTGPGQTRAAAVIVPVPTIGGRRRIKVFSLRSAKIIVDVTGYFTSESSPSSQAGLFVPVDPVRLVDTRDPAQFGRLWPRWVVEAKLPAAAASAASAVVVNVTGVETRAAGFLTVSPARQPIPGTSNVNFSAPNQVVPNHAITSVTVSHGLQVYSSHGAHVIADMAGYFTGSPKVPTLARHTNPDPLPAPPEWILRIPRIGLTSRVLAGSGSQVTNSGHSWHWTGTGYVGDSSKHVALFAHRTDAGGPYRNLDWMVVGDLFTVTTGDRREYTYRVVRRDLTDAGTNNILDAARAHRAPSLSLIACTVGFDSSKSRYPDRWAPTSLKYRIVVTSELVSWREI